MITEINEFRNRLNEKATRWNIAPFVKEFLSKSADKTPGSVYFSVNVAWQYLEIIFEAHDDDIAAIEKDMLGKFNAYLTSIDKRNIKRVVVKDTPATPAISGIKRVHGNTLSRRIAVYF